MIKHGYPLVNSPVVLEGIRMASIEDIAAMKLNAIIGYGTRNYVKRNLPIHIRIIV